MKAIDMTGWIMKEHGVPESLITVIELDADMTEKKGRRYYKCLCECGNTTITRGEYVRDGRIKSCGCLNSKNRKAEKYKNNIDITGWVLAEHGVIDSRLTVIGLNTSHALLGEPFWWDCICECGTLLTVKASELMSGKVRSCGCLQKDRSYESNHKDLTGQKIGSLTVISQLPEHKNTEYLWLCQCECGKYIKVPTSCLSLHTITSCGCKKRSYGENKIKELLDNNQILYIENKAYFLDLIMPKGGVGRYDFILLNEDSKPYRLIEFDGEQHYHFVPYFHEKDGFAYQQEKDKIKNEYAKRHNLPLVRIPYDTIDTITIEDLFSDRYLV